MESVENPKTLRKHANIGMENIVDKVLGFPQAVNSPQALCCSAI